MKKLLLLISLGLFFTGSIFADHHGDEHNHEGHDHGGHDHSGHDHGHGHDAIREIPQEQTGPMGRENLQKLIKKNKLDKAWYGSSFVASTQSKDDKSWEVDFKLDQNGKESKVTIFMDSEGKFLKFTKK